jgi:hypothetical protein
MLRRKNLISPHEAEKLERWIETISYAVGMLLGGCDLDTALDLYRNQDG